MSDDAPRLDVAIANGTEAFLAAWYGPPPNPVVVPAGDEPLPLRQWWAWERAWDRPLTRQNVVLGPDEVFSDQNQTVFYVENQAVVYWGYGAGEDPPVSERFNDHGAAWTELGLWLSQFLTEVAIFELSFGADHTIVANFMDAARLDRLTADLAEFPIRGWPRARIFAGDRFIINATENPSPSDSWMVVAATPSVEVLGGSRFTSMQWDYDSRLNKG